MLLGSGSGLTYLECLYGYTPFYAHTRFDTKVKIAVSVDVFRCGIYDLTGAEPPLLLAVPSCPPKRQTRLP